MTNAKNLAKKNSGYEVYDASGKVMYDPAATDTPASTTPAKKSTTEIAKEVIAGKWGNGDARKKKLAAGTVERTFRRPLQPIRQTSGGIASGKGTAAVFAA